jgi:hypothetical protein
MKFIKIKKSGKIFLGDSENEPLKLQRVDNLKEYLSCNLEVEEGMLFGTFFDLILKEKEFFNIVFHQELNGKTLEYFENKMKEKPKSIKEDYYINFLEISKIFEFFTFDKGNTIDLFSMFLGIGKTDDDFDVFIPLSLYSVNELKKMELFVNRVVEVYRDISEDMDFDDDDGEDDEEYVNDEGVKPFFEALTKITLYEAIQSILFEISYYKTEEEQLKVRQNQNKEHVVENKISILEQQLKEHIANEEYERASFVKQKLYKLKSKN